LFQYILFEKYICILVLEMASPGNQHCSLWVCDFVLLCAASIGWRLTAAATVNSNSSQQPYYSSLD